MIPLMHVELLNVVKGLSTFLAEAPVLVPVDFVFKYVALQDDLLSHLAFLTLTI